MFARKANIVSLPRRLLVVLVFVGFYLDVLPTPTPGADPSAARLSTTGIPCSERPDDRERDDTPDEAGNLAWPEATLVGRFRPARPHAAPRESIAERTQRAVSCFFQNTETTAVCRSSTILSILVARLIC